MERINGILFKQMLESGMNNLSNHSAEIDALNVFPVPDGDTGTNMHLTVSNGVKEALKTNSDSVKAIAKTLSRGLLMVHVGTLVLLRLRFLEESIKRLKI